MKQPEIMHSFILNYNKTMVKKAMVTENATQIDLAHDERTHSPMNLEFYTSALKMLEHFDLVMSPSAMNHTIDRNYLYLCPILAAQVV